MDGAGESGGCGRVHGRVEHMETLTTMLVLGFGLVLFAGVTVRLVLALRRRRPGSSLRDSVLRPLLGASAVSVLLAAPPNT